MALDAHITGALDFSQDYGDFKSKLREDVVLLRLDERSAINRKQRLFSALSSLGEFTDALDTHTDMTNLERPWDILKEENKLKYEPDDMIKMYMDRHPEAGADKE